jgi:hypothetical protein
LLEVGAGKILRRTSEFRFGSEVFSSFRLATWREKFFGKSREPQGNRGGPTSV